MYKQIYASDVEEYIKQGHRVLCADFENEDVESVNLMTVDEWTRLVRCRYDGGFVFAVKVDENEV